MSLVEARDHVRNFQPPVRGEEIMAALGVSEGLAVGILKEVIRTKGARGFFFESYNARAFTQATGLDLNFVQDNHSLSRLPVIVGEVRLRRIDNSFPFFPIIFPCHIRSVQN